LTALAGQVNIEARGPLTSQYISTTIKSGESQAKSLAASIIIDGHTDFMIKVERMMLTIVCEALLVQQW
jgi:filamentous hemagglutinin